MLRFYRSPTLSRVLLRRYSAATAPATAPAFDSVSEPLFSYLEGFPKPDPKYAETILAIPRSISGKSISAKERKAGRVPSIVFEQEDGQHGGNKRLISVRTNQIVKLVKNLGRSFFLSRLFDLEVLSDFESGDIVEKVRVLPRKVLYYPVLGRISSSSHIRYGFCKLLLGSCMIFPTYWVWEVIYKKAWNNDDCFMGEKDYVLYFGVHILAPLDISYA